MHTTVGTWRKSSRSGGNQSNGCVEARLNCAQPQLSDSQHGGIRPIMDVTTNDYQALLHSIKAAS